MSGKRRRRRKPPVKQIVAVVLFLALVLSQGSGILSSILVGPSISTQDVYTTESSDYSSDDSSTDNSAAGKSTAANTTTSVGGNMEVHFIDVGQGDSTLIECDGEYMLVDAGQNDQGLVLWDYLQEQGATHLKYAIGTHPDADHIGGLDVVLYRCDVDTVIMPDVEHDTKTYDDVIQTMKNKSLERTDPVVGDVYTLGSATFTIVAPNKDYGSDDMNDWSVGILLQNGDDRFLLIGDAETEAEDDIVANGIDISADVYKVAHHGSNTGTTDALLAAVNPTYAVISCGADNSYGHPHGSVLNKLKNAGIKVFRTDEQGTIIAYSSGNGITWSTEPSTTWKAGTYSGDK